MTQAVTIDETIDVMVYKRAALYIRVSSKKQEEEGFSIDGQKEQLLAHCLANKYLVDRERHVYIEVHTGIEYRERPVLTAMLQAARRGEFDVVVVYALDRLARNRTHQAIIREDLQYHGVSIESLKQDENADDNTIAGEIIRLVYGFVAEEEHKNIVRRTNDGRVSKAQAGSLLGGNKPLYGYEWVIWNTEDGKDRRRYQYKPQEQEVVLRMFHLVDEGTTLRGLANILTDEGIPTPSGKSKWNVPTIRYILTNPLYTGKAAVFRVTHVKEQGKPSKRIDRPEEEQIPLPEGVVPPIIDVETFERVQQQLKRNKEEASRNNKNPQDTLLRCGHVFCGYCGHRMNVLRVGKKKRPNYRCSMRNVRYNDCHGAFISAAVLDAAVWEHAVEIIKDPKLVAQNLEARKQQKNPVEGELSPVERREKRLREIEQEMQNLVELAKLAPNRTVLETTGGLLAALEQEQQKVEKEKQQLLNLDKEYKKDQEALVVFEQKCATYRKKLESPNPTFTYKEKREVLEYFGIKALVWRTDHKPRHEIIAHPPTIVNNTTYHLSRRCW